MYKRVWYFKVNVKGFDTRIFVYGTEEEAQEYMKWEFGYLPGYTGATEQEEAAARLLGMKIYLAPEVKY